MLSGWRKETTQGWQGCIVFDIAQLFALHHLIPKAEFLKTRVVEEVINSYLMKWSLFVSIGCHMTPG